jgi:hypothetical protein
LTSEAARLIVPDTQLRRLGLPPPENSKKEARLFFFDEANVSWCPKTGRVYRQQGSEYKVNTPGKNQRKYLIGSLEYPSGAGLYEIYANKTHLQMKTHWQNLIDIYPDECYLSFGIMPQVIQRRSWMISLSTTKTDCG